MYFSSDRPRGTFQAKYVGADDEDTLNSDGIPKNKESSENSGNWNIFKNGIKINSYKGEWIPTDKPSILDNLLYKN